ncbi:conserved hypothetical protein [Verticillium alfalfae VaMs.102]|uniref:ATP synthase subunit 5, mitochondrial n=1 Tax=Verticillium alfalfae (strain VaMs.102 / ATCC MYA-4576 / FGSC 10136) TaxID=526221 RepID=C9SQC1_VERA1|nr:conserved hypothetical protein [Verticillium alfalfae VaMs.102]EEY21046.1 conserved hypothetical protein [Verticillium alfalfae VaMs.102]
MSDYSLVFTPPLPCPGSKTLNRLETAVAKSPYVGQGKKLKVTNQIVGGLIVEVGDRTIDLSVSSKIAKMNKLLTDNL